MGVLEKQNRERLRKNRLKTLILEAIQTAGVLSEALIVPTVMATMTKLEELPSLRQKEVIKYALRRLVKSGFMRWEGDKYELTEKGKRFLQMQLIKYASEERPRHWDGKWRILIFDIPERRRNVRIKLRATLQLLGFRRLQDSVWVYPYDCEEVIALIKVDFHIGNDVLYIIADSIEQDSVLRRHFKLPLR